jgi:hypothetical protein
MGKQARLAQRFPNLQVLFSSCAGVDQSDLIQGFFGDMQGLLAHFEGGRLKALGVASSKRPPSLPDVKTLEEQGIRGVDTNNWYAAFLRRPRRRRKSSRHATRRYATPWPTRSCGRSC